MELPLTRFSSTTVSQWNKYFVDDSLIGIVGPIILVISIFLLLKKRLYAKEGHTLLMAALSIFSLFLSLSISAFFWNMLPVAFIQFPFRLLSIFIVCISFLASFCISQLSKRNAYICGVIFIVIALFSAFPYLTPSRYLDKDDSYYATNEDSTTVKNEYMNIYAKESPKNHFNEKVAVVEGNATVNNVKYSSKRISFDSLINNHALFQVNTSYFSGWSVLVDNKPWEYLIDNKRYGEMLVAVSDGKHTVEFIFSETRLRLIADIISVVSFVILLTIVIIRRKKEKK